MVIFMAVVVVAVLLVRSARADAKAAQQRADQAHHELRNALENHDKALAERGKASARSARSTFDGHVAENAFPYAAKHIYHPKDIVHVGGIIDFLVFDGLFEIRQGTRALDELTVVLADVKYGSSTLSREQHAVLTAMNNGRTRGEHWKARADNAQLTYQPRRQMPLPRDGAPSAGGPPSAAARVAGPADGHTPKT
ncbi:Holliday junction resolvase-like protein [Streptomyces rimosus]|uniref:Holliday junction resolvase-like protein n=1 Tax=Streptomyces rimosus TaxID=1927 RepID=UPI0031DED4B8